MKAFMRENLKFLQQHLYILTQINYYNNNDNNENCHLIIVTNLDNIHYRIAYHNISNLNVDLNFEILLEDNNLQIISEIGKKDGINLDTDINSIIKKLNDIISEFNNLTNYSLEEILKLYEMSNLNNQDMMTYLLFI